MPSVFHKPLNNVSTTVAAARSAGSPSIVVAAGTGASFGSTFPLVATASRAGAVLAIFEVTGRSTDTLTVSGPIEGTTDVALAIGDLIEMRPTALAIAEIQAAVNALEATAIVLPYATDAQAAFPGFDVACYGDSITAGGQDGSGVTYPNTLPTLVPRVVYNGGVSGDTSAQVATRLIADTARYAWSYVIEAGRNDPPASITQSQTMANIASMVAAFGHTRYLVQTVLNASTEPSGSAAYNAVIALNNAILSTYPNNSIDMRVLLVADYDPGQPQDVIDHGNDVPPTSLRWDSIHPNAAGSRRMAQHVADRIAVLDGAAVPLKPASLGPLMLAQQDEVTLDTAQTITGHKVFTGPLESHSPSNGLLLTDATGGSSFHIILGGGVVYGETSTDGFATAHTLWYNDGTTLGIFSAISASGSITGSSFHGDGSALTGLTSAQVGLGSVENTALSTWAGSANLATVGTIAAGTWHGTAIADAYVASAATWNAKQAAGNYLTALTGDVTASGPGSATATLAGVVTAGTSPKVTYDAKGRVTAGAALVAADIPNLDAAKVTTGTLATARIGSGTPAAGKYVDGAAGAWTTLPAAGANALGTYLVQTATNAPASAQVLASLATGLMKVTTSTGVVSVATAGTDYLTPTGSGSGLTHLTAANIDAGTAAISITGNAAGLTAPIAESQVTNLTTDLGSITTRLTNLETITEVSVTAATTLTSAAFGKYHACSGTTAGYTVTLPTAVGNAGKTIGFRMSGSLTKLVTLDGNASEAIDGSLTRVMWSGETAVLESDGSNWYKLSGKSRPMVCILRLASATPGSAQGIPNGAITKVLLNQVDLDNSSLMGDATNNRVVVARGGLYLLGCQATWNNLPVTPRVLTLTYRNGAIAPIQAEQAAGNAGASPSPGSCGLISLVAADAIDLRAYQTSGATQQLFGDPTGTTCQINLTEVPSW